MTKQRTSIKIEMLEISIKTDNPETARQAMHLAGQLIGGAIASAFAPPPELLPAPEPLPAPRKKRLPAESTVVKEPS